MSESASTIDQNQRNWARASGCDQERRGYLRSVRDNLFQGLHHQTEAELRHGDGAELEELPRRPAKMRALASSSALAVNFFDAWRDEDKSSLAAALDLPAPIRTLQFEFKPRGYPVRPRSPNLDLLLQLSDGQSVGVECKFSEPFRTDEGHGILSARYFPDSGALWRKVDLDGAQALADRLRPEWMRLDAAQLLKHMLGLANAPERPGTLLYIWFDVEQRDSRMHQLEIDRFSAAVAGGAVSFRATTYQAIFGRLRGSDLPSEEWRTYMGARYFPSAAV